MHRTQCNNGENALLIMIITIIIIIMRDLQVSTQVDTQTDNKQTQANRREIDR
jgi:hypothetical protein